MIAPRLRQIATPFVIAALFSFSPSALAGPSGGFPAHHQNKAKPVHIRDVGKGIGKVGRGIGKGIGAVGRGIFQIGKGVVKGGGKVIGGVVGGVADGGREVAGGVRKAFARDRAGEAAAEGLSDSAPVDAAAAAQKVEQMNQSASSAGKPCVGCEEKARAEAAAAADAATKTPQGTLSDAAVTLACEDERIEDYLLGMEAFLSARSNASKAEKQALATRAAQLMYGTKQDMRKTEPARLGAKASQLLNSTQNWAAGGLVEHSLAATFGEGAGPQTLQQADLRGLAAVCGTPNRFREGGPFEQLKLDLAALARQDQTPDSGLLNRTLIYCPRLAFELAYESKSFADGQKFCEAGIAQYLGVKPATEEPPSTVASQESPPASEAPTSGGEAGSSGAPSSQSPTTTPTPHQEHSTPDYDASLVANGWTPGSTLQKIVDPEGKLGDQADREARIDALLKPAKPLSRSEARKAQILRNFLEDQKLRRPREASYYGKALDQELASAKNEMLLQPKARLDTREFRLRESRRVQSKIFEVQTEYDKWNSDSGGGDEGNLNAVEYRNRIRALERFRDIELADSKRDAEIIKPVAESIKRLDQALTETPGLKELVKQDTALQQVPYLTENPKDPFDSDPELRAAAALDKNVAARSVTRNAEAFLDTYAKVAKLDGAIQHWGDTRTMNQTSSPSKDLEKEFEHNQAFYPDYQSDRAKAWRHFLFVKIREKDKKALWLLNHYKDK